MNGYCGAHGSSYRNDSKDATKDATPHTITVAVVRLEPVPPPEAPPGMSNVQDKLATELSESYALRRASKSLGRHRS